MRLELNRRAGRWNIKLHIWNKKKYAVNISKYLLDYPPEDLIIVIESWLEGLEERLNQEAQKLKERKKALRQMVKKVNPNKSIPSRIDIDEFGHVKIDVTSTQPEDPKETSEMSLSSETRKAMINHADRTIKDLKI